MPIPTPQHDFDGRLILTGLAGLDHALKRTQPQRLISILDPDDMIETPAGIDPEFHLRLEYHDCAAPLEGFVQPQAEHVRALIHFGECWDEQFPLLVHCAAGVSRSSAAVLILLALKNPQKEAAAARLLVRRAFHIKPNVLMIELADKLMGCNGRLVAALNSMPDPSLRDFTGRFVSVPAQVR